MAGYKWHIIFGVLFAGLFVYISYKYKIFNLTFLEIISAAPILLIYSILPDIDVSSSKISSLFRVVGLSIILVAILFDLKILAISIASILLILQFVKHRKFIHTVTAGVIFSLPLLYFNFIIALFAFIGYSSHLLIDRQVKFI